MGRLVGVRESDGKEGEVLFWLGFWERFYLGVRSKVWS